MRARAFPCPPDYLCSPPTIQEDLANGRPNLECHSSFYFGFGLLGLYRASFLVHVRHSDLKLDPTKTDPAMSMLKTNLYPNWTTTLEQQEVRKCPLCIKIFLPLCGQPWFFDRWPTYRNISVLRKVFQAIELQKDRVIAQSRRGQDREHIPVLPRLFELIGRYHHCGVLYLRRVSNSSELKSFLLSMCTEAPESTTKSRSSGDFEVGAGVALASTGEFHAALSALLSL